LAVGGATYAAVRGSGILVRAKAGRALARRTGRAADWSFGVVAHAFSIHCTTTVACSMFIPHAKAISPAFAAVNSIVTGHQ
jgi:hypothetical protein